MALVVTPEDRRTAALLGLVLVGLLVLGVPIGTTLLLRSRQAYNDELRQALADVQDARGKVRDRQARRDAILARYSARAPTLAGFLAEAARQQKLELVDSVDRPDQAHGKRYVERSTTVRIRKAGMLAVARLLESVVKSGNPVILSRLSIRKRAGEVDSYDVELGLSAFDRNEKPVDPDKDKK
jgi:general secretion pathway protein M